MRNDYMILSPDRLEEISGEGPIVHSEFRSLARKALEARALLARAEESLNDSPVDRLVTDIKKFLRGRI
jgi:hypothetical protein